MSSTQVWTCHRSTWSTPSRFSDASSVLSRWPRETSVTRRPVRRRDAGLGGDHHLVAGDDVADQGRDQLLGGAVAVARGGVDQGPAGLGERDQLVAGLVLVGVASPGEGAEPEPGDLQTGVPQGALQHGAEAIRRLARRVGPPQGRRPRHPPGADRVPPDLEQRAPADLPRAVRLGRPGRGLHGGDPDRHRARGAALLPQGHLADRVDLAEVAVAAGAARPPRLADGLVHHHRVAADRGAGRDLQGRDRGATSATSG